MAARQLCWVMQAFVKRCCYLFIFQRIISSGCIKDYRCITDTLISRSRWHGFKSAIWSWAPTENIPGWEKRPPLSLNRPNCSHIFTSTHSPVYLLSVQFSAVQFSKGICIAQLSRMSHCAQVLRAQLTGGLSLPEGDFFQLLFNFFELILRSGEIGRVVGRLGSVRASWVV